MSNSKRGKRHRTRLLILAIIVMLLLGGFLYCYSYFKVTKVHVKGSIRYSKDEIKDMVMSGPFGDNSLYLRAKYAGKNVEGIPFIENMEIKIDSPTEVTIRVYEKSIAGCVHYLGRYMYFDKDGIIVETTLEKEEDIPNILGLDFDHCIMYEALPVKNKEVFKSILSLTQLLGKYEIRCDNILFSKDGNITLYFGKARVMLGKMDNIDEKMIKLQYIIPELDGRSGVLHMENYSEDSEKDYITFEKDAS